MRTATLTPLLVWIACGTTPTKDASTDTDPADAEVADTDVDVADTEVAPTPVPDTDASSVDTSNTPELGIRLRLPPAPMPAGDDGEVRGRVFSIDHLPTALTITVSSDIDGPLASPAVIQADGRFTWPVLELTPATHELTFSVTDPDGDATSARLLVDICTWPPVETFDTNVIGAGWMTFGDAHWDPGGWLEITGNAQSRAGSIYRVANKVNPGDFKMTFRIATGGGINSGADGFSVNIVDVLDVDALTTYVNTAANGGCLGYGIVPGCVTTTLTVDAFHVEMDTWYNGEGWILDPTQSNHIAINTNGSPGGHPLWASVPTLENLVWRDIEVEAVGQTVTLKMDGQTIIQGALPNFSFDGGFIGVSGSTGWATNFHRFDDLQVFDRCLVP